MTLTHPGSAGISRSSHGANLGAVDRGYPASLAVMVAEQRTADLIRTAELARTARRVRAGSTPKATAAVKGQGAFSAVRLALVQALTRYAPRSVVGNGARRGDARAASRSQLVCCA
jgi:hypothetical protein